MIICHQFSCHIRTCTDHNTIITDTCLHINNASVRITEIIDQCRLRFCSLYGNSISVSLDSINAEISCCTLMIGNQSLQAFLYCLSVTGTSIGEHNSVIQCDLPGQLVNIFILFCDPWLYFHGIGITEKSFPYSITDASPSCICILWINICLFIFRIKGGITKYKCLFVCCQCWHSCRSYRQPQGNCHCQKFLCSHFLSSSFVFILLIINDCSSDPDSHGLYHLTD